MTDALAQLSEAGVAVRLDDLSRSRLQTGDLQELVDTRSVVGVTTNPSIFAAIGVGILLVLILIAAIIALT